jgi:hypothetical protein
MCGCHKDEQMEDENGVLFAIVVYGSLKIVVFLSLWY